MFISSLAHCVVSLDKELYSTLSLLTQGPVARSLVSANRCLRGIKMYRFPWYLTLVSTNHASSNPSQEFKWVPATYCWGVTLRWTHHSVKSGGGRGRGGVAILLFYYLKVTNIIQSWTRRILKMKKYVNSSDLIFRNFARIILMFIKTVQKHSVSFNPNRQGTSKFFFV